MVWDTQTCQDVMNDRIIGDYDWILSDTCYKCLCVLPAMCVSVHMGEGLLTELSSSPLVFSTFYRMQVLMIDSELGLAG